MTGDTCGGTVRNKAAGGRHVAARTAKAASWGRSKQQEESVMVVEERVVAADKQGRRSE